jgi:hypothetical protein
MDQSTKRSERITAVFSTIVAIGILAVGVTAQQEFTAPADVLVHLESDLRFQLDSAFRLNPKQGLERVKQLEAVLGKWREAEQTAAGQGLLANWLLEATIRSMPGNIQPLPAAPQFGESNITELPPAPPQEVPPPIDPSPAKPVGDAPTVEVTDLPPQSSKPETIAASLTVSPAMVDRPIDPPAIAATPIVTTPTQTEGPFVEVSTKVASLVPQPIESQAAKPVVINLSELTARVTGYHRGLDDVEAALLVHERPQFKLLSQQIRMLNGLVDDHQFVRLYFESLTPEERRAMAAPRSMKPTLGELRRHLDRLQREVESDFLGEFDTAMTKQLGQLHNQLDSIEEKIVW